MSSAIRCGRVLHNELKQKQVASVPEPQARDNGPDPFVRRARRAAFAIRRNEVGSTPLA